MSANNTTELLPQEELAELSNNGESEHIDETSLLTEEDLSWLNQLAMNEIAEDDLTAINELIIADVPHLNYAKADKRDNSRDARTLFYEDVLGWGNEESSYKSSYEQMKRELKSSSKGMQSGRSTGSFVATMRKVNELNLDPARIAKSTPHIMMYTPDRLQASYDVIDELGFDAGKITHLSPGVLVRSPESLRKNFTELSIYFEVRGLDVRSIVERAPFVLDHSAEAINSKMRDLSNLGLDADWLIKTKPTIISQSADSIRERFVFLAEHGLNAAKLIGRAPSILEYSSERIIANVNFMESVGLDVPKVTFNAPTMLCLSTENIQQKLDSLGELGLDPVAIINRSATVATYSAETIKAKMSFMDSLLKTLDTSVGAAELIQTNPDLLSRDINNIFIAARFAQVQGKPLDTLQLISSALSKNVDEVVLRAIKDMDGVDIKIPAKKNEYHALVTEYLERPDMRRKFGKMLMNTLIHHENSRKTQFLNDNEVDTIKHSMTTAGDSITSLPIIARDPAVKDSKAKN